MHIHSHSTLCFAGARGNRLIAVNIHGQWSTPTQTRKILQRTIQSTAKRGLQKRRAGVAEGKNRRRRRRIRDRWRKRRGAQGVVGGGERSGGIVGCCD